MPAKWSGSGVRASVEEMYPLPQTGFYRSHASEARTLRRVPAGTFSRCGDCGLNCSILWQPDRAYFGEKDMQQLAVIRRMVSDLNVAGEIVPGADGAGSGWIGRELEESVPGCEQRRIAPMLFRALQEAERLIRSGEKDVAKVRESALRLLTDVRVRVPRDRRPEDNATVAGVTGPVRIAVCPSGLENYSLIDTFWSEQEEREDRPCSFPMAQFLSRSDEN